MLDKIGRMSRGLRPGLKLGVFARMIDATDRIERSEDLGRSKRGFDLLLGSSAIVPILACAMLVWIDPTAPRNLVRALVVIWTGSLLAFFAGVRRGLTFSEAGGGRPGELATMLGFFSLGVIAIVLLSPILAAIGLAAVGALDAWSARRRESPPYFSVFRPPQMALGVLALAAIQLRGG